MPRLRYALAVCGCALLVLPAAAAARPGQRDFGRTFPIASGLCTKIANGHGPAKLRPVSAQVLVLCGTLRTSFTAAQNTYFTTVGPLKQQATALIAQTRQTCRTGTKAACRAARMQARITLKELRTKVRQAAVAYRASVRAARSAFWTGIHQLRGASKIAADTGTPLTPVTTIPAAA